MRYTPEYITELAPGEVFVFGSNLAGNHAGGAARIAHDKFGACVGVGLGFFGHSYAFPTLDEHFERLNIKELETYRDIFYMDAIHHPELTFLLTKVGCGIAGYSTEEMARLFQVKLSNVVYPIEFYHPTKPV